MKYKIDRDIKQSAYMQVYSQIREDITTGIYKYGDRLPSKRILSDETGTSIITVEHAYAILCDEGYAEARQRSGYFVVYKETDCFSVASRPQKRIVAENKHNDGEFPFSVFSKTARRVIAEYGNKIYEKTQNEGSIELRTAISEYLLRSRGMEALPENIIIGSGAEYLYGLIVQILGRKKYAVEDPSYEKIEKVYLAQGAQTEKLEMGDDGIKTDALERCEAKNLHITPFNSYPSGITASASKRREYVNWAKKREGIIIEDDFCSEFSELTKTEDTVYSLYPKGTIYLNTFSKTIAPAVRMGYMVLPEKIMKKYRSRAGFYSCTVSAFEQYVIAEIINSGDFERNINRIRRKRRKGT